MVLRASVLFIFAALLLACACVRADTLTLESTTATDCANLTSTPLGAPQIARLWTACAANAICASQFSEDVFAAQVVEFGTAPMTMQGAVVDTICGQTLDEIEDALWVQNLLIGILTNAACASNEKYRDGQCVTTQDNSLNDAFALDLAGIVLAIIIAAIMTLVTVYSVSKAIHHNWKLLKKR